VSVSQRATGLEKFEHAHIQAYISAPKEVIVGETFEVRIDPPVTSVSPGESVTYDVLIHNLKNVEDTYNLGLNSPRENWYSLSTTSITLNPCQTKSVMLTFSPPSTATIGGYEFTVTATSQADPDTSDITNADFIIFTKIAIIESCDSTGTKKNTFDTSEEIYITGTGFSPSTTYNIYVIEDVTTWVNGMTIPPRVPSTITSISLDNYGNIQVTLLWIGQPVPGKYDVAVDSDGDGIYNAGADADAIDDNDI